MEEITKELNVEQKERRRYRGMSQREINNAIGRESRAVANDIGEIPPCQNPDRVERAKKDFLFFCKTYFPRVFTKKFGKYHRMIAKECERIVKRGGKQGCAAPRGFCKSTFLRAMLAYALLCFPERHKFLIFIGATESATKETKNWLWRNFMENPEIVADFPQVAIPFQAYNEKRQAAPTYHGKPINAKWNGPKLILPTIEGSPQSGIAIEFFSISSRSIRGRDHIIDAVAYRPSIVGVDDPQNDKGAESQVQVTSFKNVLFRAIKELAGVDPVTGFEMEIGVFIACTCIAMNDLAVQILDHKEHPDYRGIKLSRMVTMPANRKLWHQYREIRAASLIEHGDIRDATKFYKEHRKEMDYGAETISPQDRKKGQISGIQFAMDKWAEDEASFYTEQQNDPERAIYVGEHSVTPATILEKRELIPRLFVPDNTFAMTAFIDAGKNYHAYEVSAFGENRSFSHTVDYGIWPEQGIPKITKSTYKVGIQEYYNEIGDTFEDKIAAGIHDLLDKITGQTYFYRNHNDGLVDVNEEINLRHARDGFVYRKLALIGIDCQYCEKTVWQAIASYVAENPIWQDRIIPTYGAAAHTRLLRYYDLDFNAREWQRGRKIPINGRSNYDWIENPRHAMELFVDYGVAYSLKYDANMFKTLAAESWLLGKGLIGTHTIFDHPDHKMYAEHQCNEKPLHCIIGGINYNKWRVGAGLGQNSEYTDTRTGCEAIANYIGIEENK